jgi:hypothetical protein
MSDDFCHLACSILPCRIPGRLALASVQQILLGTPEINASAHLVGADEQGRWDPETE